MRLSLARQLIWTLASHKQKLHEKCPKKEIIENHVEIIENHKEIIDNPFEVIDYPKERIKNHIETHTDQRHDSRCDRKPTT